QDAALGDEHQLVVVADGGHVDDRAVAVGRLDVDDAAAAAALEAVLLDRGALAVPVLAGGEDHAELFAVAGAGDDDHADDAVVRVQVDAAHAAGGSAHGAGVALLEADGHPAARAQQDLVVVAGDG